MTDAALRPDQVSDGVTLRRGLGVLGQAVRQQPWVFAVAVIASAVYGAMTVVQALVVGAVTSRVILPAFEQGRTVTGSLTVAGLVLVGAAVLKATSVLVRRVVAGMMQYRLNATYRRRVTGHFLRLPLSWHARHPTGQLLSNANADVEATWAVIAPFPMAVGVLVMLVVATAALLATDLVLTLVGLTVFPAIFVVNAVYRRYVSPLAAEVQRLRASVSEVAHESFEGALLVKTLGREEAETARFRQASEALRDVQIRVGRIRGVFDPVMESLPTLGVLAVLFLGAQRINSGDLQAGELVQVAYLFALLSFPVRAIGWVLAELPRSVVGWDRVHAVLDFPPESRSGGRPLRGSGPVALGAHGVGFGYEAGGEQPDDGHREDTNDALTDFTLDVAPGTTTAIVGPTGSGKSTLAALLVRLVDPVTGAILLDGVDLRELRDSDVADAIALVPQSAFLFADTVRANVTLGADYDDAQVREALRRARADSFVEALPEGLDTLLGERGTTLSGGQRQRLALARALIRTPRLLVLDDATSAVDSRVEGEILAELRGNDEAARPTLVVIAYRRATISLADEVVYVERGRIVDRGTSAELLDRCAGYRELVTAYDQDEAQLEGQAP